MSSLGIQNDLEKQKTTNQADTFMNEYSPMLQKSYYNNPSKTTPQRSSAKKVVGNTWFQLTSSHHFINIPRYYNNGSSNQSRKDKPSSSSTATKPYYSMADSLNINTHDNFPGSDDAIGRCSKEELLKVKKIILLELLSRNKIPEEVIASARSVEDGSIIFDKILKKSELFIDGNGYIAIKLIKNKHNKQKELSRSMIASEQPHSEESPQKQETENITSDQQKTLPQNEIKDARITLARNVKCFKREKAIIPYKNKRVNKTAVDTLKPHNSEKPKASLCSSPEKKEVKPIVPPRIPKIEIIHKCDDHLLNHPLNQLIKSINEFSTYINTLKAKSDPLNQDYIFQLSRKLNLGVCKNMFKVNEFLKSKDSITFYREKVLKVLHQKILDENGFTADDFKQSQYFKFYVSRGNNDMIVKSILKQRPWWTSNDSKETSNLIWTQWKRKEVITTLQQYKAKQSTINLAKSPLNSDLAIESVNIDKPIAPIEMQSLPVKAAEEEIPPIVFNGMKMHNHLEGNYHLGHKKAMYINLKAYYEACGMNLYDLIPDTYLISKGLTDPEFIKFKERYTDIEKVEDEKEKLKNVWIIKPGENTNRGNGITVSKCLTEIENLVQGSSTTHTYIIQKYIEKPLLYNKRKFDIRCYSLITGMKGNLKAYFYKEGYMRTSSKDFTLNNLQNKAVHLTNEAIQKNFDDFGKFENGNKLTYADFQKYLDSTYPQLSIDFYLDIVSQIKKAITDCIRCAYDKLDPHRRMHTFEIFGYDFMISSDFKIYLIEVNINPCLEIMSTITARIVPTMLDNAFRIALDPYFNSGEQAKRTYNDTMPEIKYELIYDSKIDDPIQMELRKKYKEVPGKRVT